MDLNTAETCLLLPILLSLLQLMTHVPLGMDGFPPWDVWCIHYTCNPNRTDVLMRASHIIGDGQLFMKIIKQIMEPLDGTAAADYAATVLADPRAPGSSRSVRRKDTDISEPISEDEVRRSLSSDSSCSSSSGAYDSESGGSTFRVGSSSSSDSSCGDLDSSNSLEIEEEQRQRQRLGHRKGAADCVVHLQPAVQEQADKLQQQLNGVQLQQQEPVQQQQQRRRRQRGVWQQLLQCFMLVWR